MFKVLSIDGGGIRGIFPARFLQRCEEEWGKPLCENFDLITGTSTGGIIALGAAYRKPMSAIVALYADHARSIFQRTNFLSSRTFSIFNSKYDNAGLLRLLKSTFSSEASFDAPSCHVRVQAFNLQTGTSKIFRAGGPYRSDSQFRIWEVAAATSAAPTYFPTFAVPTKGVFVDGGVWANNPAVVGMVEALILHQKLDDVGILSVGTGGKIFRGSGIRFGLWSWRSDLIELVFRSQIDGTDQLAQALHGKHVQCYKRVSEPLKPDESALDAIHTTEVLCGLADDKFEREKSDLESLFFS